jgi:hypothetical protein
MYVTNVEHTFDDLPGLPPGLIVAWDIHGRWIYRAILTVKLISMLLRVLNPWRSGMRLYVIDGGQ